MEILHIVSVAEGAGKTAICAGLAINFVNSGKKVAYLKNGASDGDADFMNKVPGLAVSAKARDIVLTEGTLGPIAHDEVSRAAYRAAKETRAKVVAVEVYSDEGPRFFDVYRGFGPNLLGMIINKAPQSQLKRIREEVGARCEKAGVKLLGVIPENRVLMAITVGELAESLGGKILNNTDKSEELVESYMVGAMVVGSGLDYFGRKSYKAAIVHHDRPDMQLAALETSTACLVLSGSPDKSKPIYNVMYKAQSRGIPIVATGAAVKDIVATIEETLLKTRLRQSGKLTRLAETVRQNLDIKALA